MDEEYYLTEEQRIRLEIEKEEKKKLKKEAGVVGDGSAERRLRDSFFWL